MEAMTTLNQLSFWLFAGLMIAGALGVVFHRSIVYSALMLLVTFLAIAGVFVLLNAPFIAAAQILVYGVGLTIVLIFGIMLTGDKPFQDPVGHERPKRHWLIPGVLGAAFLGFLMWTMLYPNAQLTAINGLFISRVDPNTSDPTSLPGVQAILADGGITHIAELLFSQYLIPFELVSILLLLAVMGAIILSKREFPEEEGEAPLPGELASGILGSAEALGPQCAPPSTVDRALTGASDEADTTEKETIGVG